MKRKGIKVAMVIGATAFALSVGILGTYFVSQAQPNDYKVVESGILKENEPQVVNLANVSKPKDLETDGGIQNVTNETTNNVQKAAKEREMQYANSKIEEEWTALASDALKKYFNVDVSNLQSVFTAFPAMEVYDVFSDSAGGEKVLANSVTTDEAQKMAEEFIINKKLATSENMEYIGAKSTSEGRIHVSFKVDDDQSISVGIDTYTNEIKSFFIRNLEYANVMQFSSPEDAVG